jgi:ribosomal-protein-serine acetyltransferase
MDVGLKTEFVVGDGITLRAWREDDVQIALDAVKRNSEHLEAFMRWMTPEYDLAASQKFIAEAIISRLQRKKLQLGIFDGGELVGSIGYVYLDFDANKTEIGYWIDREAEGKGIITRACRVLIDYAFNELGMNRVEIRCSVKNVRSAAIPERLGFKKEGVLRQAEPLKDGLHDFNIYGLLAQDPRPD